VRRAGRRLLITGGLGFIGSAAAERFLQQGEAVTIVDSCVANVVDPATLGGPFSAAEVICASVEKHFQDPACVAGYDLVIHAASCVGPASLLAQQGAIGPEIVGATQAVIRACLLTGVPLVYLSSAEVYGRSGTLGEASAVRIPPHYNARIEYALAKLTSEAMVVNSRVQGLRSVVIRPFNVAGAAQSRAGGFVMPTFVQQALGDRPLTVFGSGQQKRAFLGVTDLAHFFSEHVSDDLCAQAGVYNLGNPGNATTILDLARRVKDRLGSRSEIVHLDPKTVYGSRYEEAESFEKLPDVKRVAALGWRPKQSLDDIIHEVAEYYRRRRDPRGADARLVASAGA
jgi:nucleoside-diphosphate-sugar epimerase